MEKLHYTIVLKSMIGPRSGSLSTSVEKMEYDAVLHTEEDRLTGGFVTASGCWEVEGFLRAKNPLARAKRAE